LLPMTTRTELELRMIPVDEEEGHTVDSGLGARRGRSIGSRLVAAGGIVTIGVLGLRAGNQHPKSAQYLQASPAATAGPHKVSPESSTTTVPETTTSTVPGSRGATAADIPEFANFNFIHDGFTGKCRVGRTVVVESLKDAMSVVSVEGIKPANNKLIGHVVGANANYNRIENGIQRNDWNNMQPGATWTLIDDCVFKSPVIEYQGSKAYELEYQATGETVYYSAFTNQVLGCSPEPVCQEPVPAG